MGQRVAVVTGGMGGLGETISTKMADAGYQVVVTYSPSNTTSDKWLSGMKAKKYIFRAYGVDVGEYDSCEKCIAQIVQDVGPVDIPVNNAGITRDMTFKKMTKADWDAVLHTNLDSVFNMTKQVCDGMVDRGSTCLRSTGPRVPSARPITLRPKPACTALPNRCRWKWRAKA